MAAGKILGAALLRGNASRTMGNYKRYMHAYYPNGHPDDRPASAAAPSAAAAPK